MQKALYNTPTRKDGKRDLTKLPPHIKKAIRVDSVDGKLNMHNYLQLYNTVKEEEPKKLAKEFLDEAIKLKENHEELGMYEMADRLKSPRLESYLQYSGENRKSFLTALRELLDELRSEQAKQIMAYLQPLQEGVIDTKDEPILLRMFFKGGNAFLVNGFPPYRDEIQSGGTAKKAKSRQRGGTRKGKGPKGAKNGKKKTRRVRCWSRRNKEAQRYVVCSGSRGQKTVRNTNKELEKAFKDLARLGVKPPFKNYKRINPKKAVGQLSLEWRKANPVKIDKM